MVTLSVLLGSMFPLMAGADVINVQTISAESLSGRIRNLSAQDGLILELADGSGPKRIAIHDLVRMERAVASVEQKSDQVRLDLAGGDRLFGRPVGSERDSVRFHTNLFGPLSIRLDRIARWTPVGVKNSSANVVQPQGVNARKSAADADVLWLANGDVAQGVITRIDENGFSILADDGGQRLIPHSLILGAEVVSAEVAPHTHPVLRVQGVDGSIVTAVEFRESEGGDRLLITDGGGMEIELNAEQWVSASVIGGRWERLSQHEPISFQHTPFLSLGWEYRRGTNVRGGPIVIAGRHFEDGVGVHSAAWLIYDLKGRYSEFVTFYGLDDDSGPWADVDVAILVDGQPRHSEKGLKAGTLRGPLRIDVRGAMRLELVVDFGRGGDVQDRFDWADAALVRAE